MLVCLVYVTTRGGRVVPWRQAHYRAGGRLFIESDAHEPTGTHPLAEVKSKRPDGYSLGGTPLTL